MGKRTKQITAALILTVLFAQTVYAASSPVEITAGPYVLNEDVTVTSSGSFNTFAVHLNGNDIAAVINGDVSMTENKSSTTYGVIAEGTGSVLETGDVSAVGPSKVIGVEARPTVKEVRVGDVTVTGSNGIGIGAYAETACAGKVSVSVSGSDTSYGIKSEVVGSSTRVKTEDITVSTTFAESAAYGIFMVNNATVGAKGEVLVDGGIRTSGSGSRGIYYNAGDDSSNTGAAVVNGDVTGEYIGIEVSSKGGQFTAAVDGAVEAKYALRVGDNYDRFTLIVYELKAGEDGMLARVGNIPEEAKSEAFLQTVNYIIRTGENSSALTVSGTAEKDVAVGTESFSYRTATEGTALHVRVASGYELVKNGLSVVRESDGSYTVTVPRGGGVTLDAVLKAVEKEEEKKASFTGTEGTPVTNGQWNMGPGGIWTFRTDGIFRDTWGYITLANGKTGWFYFDKNGVMLTGRQQIGGKWYCFNEAHDGTYGMMIP